jgi:DNA invertase Pin-like site-specific DNA recombinase
VISRYEAWRDPRHRILLAQMAAVAELEAGLIGERTKAALAAAKARGVKLGSRAQRGTPPDGYIGPVTAVTVANDGIWLPK